MITDTKPHFLTTLANRIALVMIGSAALYGVLALSGFDVPSPAAVVNLFVTEPKTILAIPFAGLCWAVADHFG